MNEVVPVSPNNFPDHTEPHWRGQACVHEKKLMVIAVGLRMLLPGLYSCDGTLIVCV